MQICPTLLETVAVQPAERDAALRLSECLRLWVGHVALWKCQNLSLDDKWSRAQHWAVLWNIWLWANWTWNSYCAVPFPVSAHSAYWLSGSRLLTSKQDFPNFAEGSIRLLFAAMDRSSLTCWQLLQTLREPQRMQQDLNRENFLWPSQALTLG